MLGVYLNVYLCKNKASMLIFRGLSGWSQLYHSCTARRWFIEISKAPRRPKVFGQDRPRHRGFLLFYVAKKPVFFGQFWAYPIYKWERPMVTEVFPIRGMISSK